MRIIGRELIDNFIKKHPDSRAWLQAWLAEARTGEWQSPQDIKARYSSASIVDEKKIIFNVKGNTYRMEVRITYKNKIILIKRLGTHAEYDRWET